MTENNNNYCYSSNLGIFWYKLGRYLLILLPIISIVLDCNKMMQQYQKSDYLIIISKVDTVNYYSSSIFAHLIAISAAIEHEIWLSVLCRLVTVFVYHVNLKEQINTDLPKDASKLNKLLRKNMPSNISNYKSFNMFDLLYHLMCKGKRCKFNLIHLS